MFNQSGLSLDQAPPISVIFRFFFSGALFGMTAGLLVLIFKTTIFNAYSTEALILTHTLTLGVMLSFMFAALFQMLPVIAGVTLTSPLKKANFLQYPFTLGVITLLLAFYFSTPWLFGVSSLLLSASILYISIIMLKNIIKLENHSNSSRGMLVALLSLIVVIFLALYLTSTLGGAIEGTYYTQIKTAHYSFGLFGWIALLIISISFQTIEMFYVTPPYPKLVSKHLPFTLFGLLVITTIVSFFIPNIWAISNILLAIVLSGYALLTLKRLTQRKRPLTDATVWFWRLGLSSLVLSMLSMTITLFTDIQAFKTLSYILFASFGLSVVFAMFYKIVPFLTWFHLNSQGYFTAPMMHEIVHPKTAMKHLYIHVATIVTFMLSIVVLDLLYLAGALTILSFGWMAYQIIHAHTLYIHTQKTGQKMDMGSMG